MEPDARAKRVNDPEGLRRRVLDAAAEAFQARGYHAASMQEIMQAARATGGALHHHFPTKKALALAVIRERVAAAVEAAWIAPVRQAASARAGVAAAFAAIIDALDRQQSVHGCPLNNLALELSLADADFRAAIDEVFAAWRAAIAAKLAAESRSPDASAGHAQDVAALVVAAYSGAMTMAKAAQGSAPLKACAAQMDRLLA